MYLIEQLVMVTMHFKLLKLVEGLVPNFSDPIVCSFSDRRGRSCIISHVNPGPGHLSFQQL